jgi:hypothetical protein
MYLKIKKKILKYLKMHFNKTTSIISQLKNETDLNIQKGKYLNISIKHP